MKKKTVYIIYPLAFLVGLSILLYPKVSDIWNQRRADKLMTQYGATVENSGSDFTEEKEAAQAYNHTLEGGTVPDAFSVRADLQDPKYESLLNINQDGIMGSIEIPAISVELPIYHYTKDSSLQDGVGHLFGSSLPVGGESTHAVLSAHRGLPSAKLFSDLDLVEEGDVFYLHILDETLAYEVDQIKVVEPSETEDLAIVEGEDYVTLLTCTPYAVNSHRLLVRGHRVPYSEEGYAQAVEDSGGRVSVVSYINVLCGVCGAAAAIAVVLLYSRYGVRKKTAREGEAPGDIEEPPQDASPVEELPDGQHGDGDGEKP